MLAMLMAVSAARIKVFTVKMCPNILSAPNRVRQNIRLRWDRRWVYPILMIMRLRYIGFMRLAVKSGLDLG
jgi:hypothetical protein